MQRPAARRRTARRWQDAVPGASGVRVPGRLVEWPTVVVTVAVYGGWLALTFWWTSVPRPLGVGALAVLSAWHTSLQHEVIHGHPFRRRRYNDAVGWLPVSLGTPYGDYRDSHLAHHRDEHLTDPAADPESYYLSRAAWDDLSAAGRSLHTVDRTLLGRMVVGPWLTAWAYWRTVPGGVRHDGARRRHLLHHLVGSVVVLSWACGVGHVPVMLYLVSTSYLGRSLGLVRSFCEHRWVPEPHTRSAVVRAGRFWSLLFLHNNLHHTHHARPGAPWYRLPVLADALRSDAAAAEGAGLYAGYRDVARRYLVRPFDQVVHPAGVEVAV